MSNDVLIWISSGNLLALVTFLIRNENRLARLETEMKLIFEQVFKPEK